MTNTTAFAIVRAMGAGRLVAGVALVPLCALGWWVFAAVTFVVAFLTDMVDGTLARRWGVASKSGARLDSTADTVLTAGGIIGLAVSGDWSWFIPLIVAVAFVVTRLVEPELHGPALGWLIVGMPIVNLTLVGVIAAYLMQRGFGGRLDYILMAELQVAVIIAYCKRRRIYGYWAMAVERSEASRNN